MAKVKLDKEREIAWTMRAQARNSSLSHPVEFTSLVKGSKRLYALCAIVWAGLVDRDHEFEAPEDIAEFLSTAEQQLEAMKSVKAMIAEAFPSKKNENTSSDGQKPSSSLGSEPQPSTTGT